MWVECKQGKHDHLVTTYVDVLAGKQADDLLQYAFQEMEGALLAGTVHVLVYTPMHGHLSHVTYTKQECIQTTGTTRKSTWQIIVKKSRVFNVGEALI